MQTFLWQSPASPPETNVPSWVFVLPHTPAVQLNVLQGVLVPQSVASRHSTQAGAERLPLHIVPLPWLHAVPEGSGRFDGLPPLQLSEVHGLPSTKTSLSSTAETSLPVPLQTFFLQSPVICVPTRVPSGTSVVRHCPPASQANVRQSELLPQ